MRRAPALSFLLVTVFVDLLGLGLIVPIVPALLTAVTGHAGSGARWSGLIDSSYGLLQFFTAPLLGRLADRYGRRPVLLTSLAFLGVDYCAHGLARTAWLLLLFHGLAGAFAGTNTVVNAYIADVTAPERRAWAYGLIGSAFSLGFVAGPIVGGLLGAVDVRLPFYAAAFLAFANVAYGLVLLPESRRGDRTTPLTLATANPITAIAAVWRRPILGRLAIARFAADISRMTYQVLWTFFLTFQFAWGTARIGLTMAAASLASVGFQARLVDPAVRLLGEKRAAVAGNLLSAACLAGIAFAGSPLALYALQAFGVLAAVGGAAAQSWLSRSTGDDEQGTVNGALTGTAAIAEAVVPALAGAAFAWSAAQAFPGLPFLAAAAFTAVAAALLATTPAAASPKPDPAVVDC